MTSKQTPLNKEHKLRGGRMVDFAGWELPVQYGSAIAEHRAVRENVGVFDVSHMGQLEFIGPDALALAQKVTCNDVERLSDGQAQYSAFLTAEGTFVDDIVVYRISS
ncbi:MAG TPA: glycine cleavage system aminomethyltransferase GcvT, partial [Acidobacteriota bacterium]|nr:glycine cleavage system aminomethyltransferase GcvT [Acidobacteriota bacterium]